MKDGLIILLDSMNVNENQNLLCVFGVFVVIGKAAIRDAVLIIIGFIQCFVSSEFPHQRTLIAHKA